jgi:SAM-dependent methyltransferase
VRLSALSPSRVRRWGELLVRRGETVSCPVCGWGFDAFKPAVDPAAALCWRCGARDRHRAQALLLTRRGELLASAHSLLHFAPEWGMRRYVGAASHLRYVTADLDMPGTDLQLDLQATGLPDASFDAVICSHVLEHVQDDRAAMRELHRILTPGGWALVMVPLDLTREHTYEDPEIRTADARLHAFWQFDHVRLYAPDIAERLSDAGFTVETIRPLEAFGAEAMTRYGLLEADHIWLCRA